MKINSIAADADGVRERRSAISARTCFNTDVSFQHGELGSDPTALPHVRRGSQAVLCTKHLRTQPQSGISGSAIWSRRRCLHPVEETERQLTRPPKGNPPAPRPARRSGACGSPVVSAASAPMINSHPANGSRSPSSVASST